MDTRKLKIETNKQADRPFPNVSEMKKALKRVDKLLSIKQLNMAKNYAVKEGLIDCKRILYERLKNPENKWFKSEKKEDIQRSTDIYREQLKGIENLKTEIGRAMAVICVDYLNGQVGTECFDNFEKSIRMR